MQILSYNIPSLIVLLASWLTMRKIYQQEDARRMFELKRSSKQTITPIRLRGYERLALLLERITPEHLLLNIDISSLTIQQLQQQLLQTVRMEFEHNLSQQIYVSDEVWAAVVIAKEETLRFVSECASKLPSNATALQYANLMLEAYNLNGETPLQQALRLLKQEARQLY